MPSEHEVRYLPRHLAERVHRWAPKEVSASEQYSLLRLAEAIYAEGYDDGHLRGCHETRAEQERPNVNDVNALRDALTAEVVRDAQQ